MAGPDRRHQISPRAPTPSAARCPPHPPRWEPGQPRSEKSPARYAETAKETAAVQRLDHSTVIQKGAPWWSYSTSDKEPILDTGIDFFRSNDLRHMDRISREQRGNGEASSLHCR